MLRKNTSITHARGKTDYLYTQFFGPHWKNSASVVGRWKVWSHSTKLFSSPLLSYHKIPIAIILNRNMCATKGNGKAMVLWWPNWPLKWILQKKLLNFFYSWLSGLLFLTSQIMHHWKIQDGEERKLFFHRWRRSAVKRNVGEENPCDAI